MAKENRFRDRIEKITAISHQPQVPGSGMSRALFGNNFRIRNRRNETAERRPINFKFFDGVGVFSGPGVDYEYRDGA